MSKLRDSVIPPEFMNWLNSFVKTVSALPINWVDVLTLAVLCIGVVRGRKRGLSEEILDTFMWLLIIFTGAYFYKALGQAMHQKPIMSLLTYYIVSYLLVALGLKIVFVLIKKKFGAKLVESDLFGRLEFYGGMFAGAVRFTCIYFFALSILHAPYYSPEFLAKRAKEVDYNYGSDFFPHPCKIQVTVFKGSITGTTAEKYLAKLLIEQTEGTSQALRGDNSLGRRKEREMDAMLGRR